MYGGERLSLPGDMRKVKVGMRSSWRSNPHVAELRRALAAGREENPVWLSNRPGRWDRGKETIYYGSILAAWCLVIVGYSVHLGLTVATLLLLPLLVSSAQCIGAYAFVFTFDRVGNHPRVLEELSLTELTLDEIVYGSFDAGFRQAVWFFLPLLAAEIVFLGTRQFGWGIVGAMLLTPVQWTIFCRVVYVAMQDRSRMRLLPPGRSLWVLFWLAVGTLCMFYGVGLLVWVVSRQVPILAMPVFVVLPVAYWWVSIQVSISFLENAHTVAVRNYADFLSSDERRT